MRPVHVEPDSLHLASRALLQDHYHLADRLFALRWPGRVVMQRSTWVI